MAPPPPPNDPFPDIPEAPPVAHAEAQAQAIPTMGRDLGQLDFAPKADEMKPGDQFKVLVNQYKATADKIAFYRKGAKYPIFTHYFNNQYAVDKFAEITNGWQFEEDNAMHDIPDRLLIVVASDKLNSKQNPYRNLEDVCKV